TGRSVLAASVSVLVMGVALGAGAGVDETRKTIELDAAKIAAVIGRYQLEPNVELSISTFRGRLYAKTSGDPVYPIFAESETVFGYRVADARITLEKAARGKVTGARYDQGKIHSGGPKISDS